MWAVDAPAPAGGWAWGAGATGDWGLGPGPGPGVVGGHAHRVHPPLTGAPCPPPPPPLFLFPLCPHGCLERRKHARMAQLRQAPTKEIGFSLAHFRMPGPYVRQKAAAL
jgi:hypothetical protein